MKPIKTLLATALAATAFTSVSLADTKAKGTAELSVEQRVEAETEKAFIAGVARGQTLSPAQVQQMQRRYKLMQYLAAEAEKSKLDKEISVQVNLRLRRMQVLAQASIADWATKNQPTEAQVKALYEERTKNKTEDAKYEASHILLKSEEQAKEIITMLEKGGDFSKLARKYSADPTSSDEGGKLGSFGETGVVKELIAALKKMKVGEMSKKPVKSVFGYHILHYTNYTAPRRPAFADLKDDLRKELHDKMVNQFISNAENRLK